MKINRMQCLFTGVVAIGLLTVAGIAVAAAKANHHNGKQLLGEKAKTNGRHMIDKKGDYTATVEVKNGKVAGLHVNHPKKGEVPVKKYKSNKNMVAQTSGHRSPFQLAAYQDQYLGTVSIGYSYIDDYGNEQIYWFPYDMILDGDTGAIVYVPAQ